MSALRRIRINNGLSIMELATLSEVSPEQIRNLETGRASNPRVDTLTKLAKHLYCQPADLDPILTADAEAALPTEATA